MIQQIGLLHVKRNKKKDSILKVLEKNRSDITYFAPLVIHNQGGDSNP